MGYRLNRLDEPIFMAMSKPLLTEFGIHHRLESCDLYSAGKKSNNFAPVIFYTSSHLTSARNICLSVVG